MSKFKQGDLVFVTNPYSPFDTLMGTVAEMRYREPHEEYAVTFPPNNKLSYRTTSLFYVSELIGIATAGAA